MQQDPNSEAARSLVRGWLANCLQDHEQCRTSARRLPDFTPDRLVRIISPCNICLSDSHSEGVEYVALSYCWGSPTILSTTKKNLSDHLRQIPWSLVPKTFRQAIDLTLGLGYDYIWIDSLCIIQHDAEDFAEQSSKMAEIYVSAYFGHLSRLGAERRCWVFRKEIIFVNNNKHTTLETPAT